MYIVPAFLDTFLKYVYVLCRLVCICRCSYNQPQSWGVGCGGGRGWSIVCPTLSYAERSEREQFFFSVALPCSAVFI